MATSSKPEHAHARSLWLANGLPEEVLSNLTLSAQPDSAAQSSFKLGSAAQTSIGLSGLGAAYFHSLRTGTMQEVTVDARHAILETRSESWYTVDGEIPRSSPWDPLAGLYKTKDNSYVRLHTNFPHHRDGIVKLLKCEPTREAVQSALMQWNAEDFEEEAARQKMCVSAYRSFDEWRKHPQAAALINTPPVYIVKIGEAPKREVIPAAKRPLEGIRVLDLCRVLAGPVCGRSLAAHGADVLLRTTQLDLTQASARDKLKELASEADVFLQAYRPGGLEEKGFGPRELAKLRPGIVCANLTAYGWEGPWKDKRGFDSLVQTATGWNWAEGEAFAAFSGSEVKGKPEPKALPMQALDHCSGYLLAFGIHAALAKTITEGGSWEVRTSLAAVGQWLRSLGRLSPEVAFGEGRPLPPRSVPLDPEIMSFSAILHEAKGDRKRAADAHLRTMTAISHAAILSKTPVGVAEAPMGLDRHEPAWLRRTCTKE
ncbi:CoA-transferase family III [Melanogaster broomeanus]|nr:CoA-transferase family III [Melanogaster broomeanus]